MKIGLDFDGVISDCGDLKSRGARELYGVDIHPDLFKKEVVVGEGHLTAEQYLELQKKIYGTYELGFRMKPVKGAQLFIAQLMREGHTVTVVTSRIGINLKIAQDWSKMMGLKLNFVGVGHGVSKAEAARGLDVYVDDDLDKLEPLVNIVPHRFLFSWGYNMGVDLGHVAKRIYSWPELYQTIREI